MPDYARYARQVALAEVGAPGQDALSETPASFDDPLAQWLHARAGGAVEGDVSEAIPMGEGAPTRALGVAAWRSVEAARRVLQQPPRELPDALVARLTP